jgi:hypothetical protein
MTYGGLFKEAKLNRGRQRRVRRAEKFLVRRAEGWAVFRFLSRPSPLVGSARPAILLPIRGTSSTGPLSSLYTPAWAGSDDPLPGRQRDDPLPRWIMGRVAGIKARWFFLLLGRAIGRGRLLFS